MPAPAIQETRPDDLPAWLPFDELLSEVLNVSLTGLIFYLPVYDPAGSGAIVDFRFEYLNPAAQRMMRMPARPTLTHRQQWPHSEAHGTFAFHLDAYVSGEPRSYDVNYQADGYDNYYRLTARRAGPGLLVSFTDTADQPRTPVEIALRESQAREQTARAEAEAQQQHLQDILNQAPVAIALLHGPDYHIVLANPTVCQIWAREQAQVVGRPLFEALPEVRGQGLEQLLLGVLHSGQPYVGTELPIRLLRHGRLETVYFNFVYQPQRSAEGLTTGVLVVASDVTETVLARRRVEEQEHETSQLNEELAAANEEIRANNDELARSQFDLQHLNQELEARVQERTYAALALQADLLAAAQRQAQQRETFYHIFEQTPACIALLTGPEHRFEYVNAAYQQLFPGRQLVGLPLREALPETETQGFVAWMDKVYQTGETFFGTEVLLTVEQLDGQPAKDVYFTFTYQAYRENGAVAGISIFAYDVTEQVLARRQREAQQAQLAELFEQAPVAIAVLRGPEHRIEVANPLVAQIWGRSSAEVLGKPLLEALPEMREQGFKELLDQVVASGQAFAAQEVTALLPRNGTVQSVYLNFVYQPLRNPQGEVTGVAAVAVDVSEQVAARRASEASARQLRLLTDALPVLIGYLDQERCYQFANEAYRTWFDQDPAALLGRRVRDIVGEAAYAATAGYMDRALAGERLDFEAEMPYRPGLTKYIRTSYVPDVRDGQVLGFYTLVTDITEQVLARQQVQRLNDELAAANAALQARITELRGMNAQLTRTNQDLDNFVYAASHDLKQPVNNLAGLLAELRRSVSFADPAEEQLLVPMIQDALHQLGITIDDLALLGQAQKASEAPAEPVTLADLTEEVIGTLEPQMRAARARVTTDFSARPTVAFARANLRTILLNLVGNSLKYADPARPARIHISVWVDEGQPVLVVQDNGLGFDAQKYGGELFHLFRRFHTHTAGTGVGLYLVNRIVEANGGRIEVQSQEGAGATFRVHLGRA
ncbi:PAS domain-containing protein [Hymenobacter sp. 15J16-1T3B]|uniref:PAS domain-containing protein n=1 Tax=Hymenobacter sp. 15J16-1T3B TaxID=2886941 RepID=UPI001D108619|nr:PAS domain-containing protein [Hymenobacter sp. 15J16-1T3B]MCC3157796.1 PAS domain-containing protein [Hymenobacter sp. 15J16-1T3B]